MSGTDTQDPMGGQDYIYDDGDGFNQKLTPKRYPYKYEILEEKEYLFPAYTMDGSGYFTSEEKELRDYEFERRPMYVVKMTQLDNTYIYGHRILYFDKETLNLIYAENYDQRGRLYRDLNIRYYFCPEMGMYSISDLLARDMIDHHSNFQPGFVVPAPFIERNYVNIKAMIKRK